jgi:hypothetical protein
MGAYEVSCCQGSIQHRIGYSKAFHQGRQTISRRRLLVLSITYHIRSQLITLLCRLSTSSKSFYLSLRYL